jgi:RNA polymerase sigma factor (TIGR02999 family)
MRSPETIFPESFTAGMAQMREHESSLYAELVKLARSHLSRSATVSLDAPSIVHEAYLRFAGQRAIAASQRSVFFAYASQVMRTVIIDYLRERRADKRGGHQPMITLTTGIAGAALSEDDVVHLHDALSALQKIDPRSHSVVETRYFAGLTEEEIASVLGVSVPTIKRDWRKARAFLLDAMGKSLA